jgi:hypothetical protein
MVPAVPHRDELLIPRKLVEEAVVYLYQEAKAYAAIGGMNEVWGLIHGAKHLEKLLRKHD